LSLLGLSSRRYLLRHPWQFGLAVLGVALGVAVVVSIDLANTSAQRAFALSTEAITGRTTHQVVGGPTGIPDAAFLRLAMATPAGVAAAPVVEGYVNVPAAPGKPSRLLHLLGVDPFSEGAFRPYLSGGVGGGETGDRSGGDGGLSLTPFLTRPGGGVLAADTARDLDLKLGDRFQINVGGARVTVELVGTLSPADEDTRRAIGDLLVVDIATAQELLGRVGRLDRIDLIVPEGPRQPDLLRQVEAALPAGVQVLTASGRTQATEEMTRAFRLNLRALSLLALVCGLFLIYNTMTFSVVQRRTLHGTLLALGGALLAIPPGPGRGLTLSFAGLFGVILGCALLAPGSTVLLMRLLRPAMGALFGVLGRLAAGGVVASLSRTAVAIAALVIAVSVTVGMGVMIDSFRQTVVRWLESSLRADLYISAPSRGGGFSGAALDPELARRAAALPGVTGVHLLRRVELPSDSGPLRMIVLGTDGPGLESFELKEGDPEEAWPAFQRGEAVMVSEPFSRRRGVGVGSVLRLPTGEGERDFRVAGIYYDYASDQGLVLIARSAYLRLWNDPTLSGLSLDLAPGADADRVIRELRAAAGAGPGLVIASNRDLKRVSLVIFDRTFLITGVLRMLAGLVAFIGVLASLTALQLERAREMGVLRANGMTPGQVWQLITTQTGLMGLAAGLLSIPVGLALAAIMIYVINQRSFGWSMAMEVSPFILVQALLLALAAALLAGLYPAWKLARTSPALALREE
jgi:ABC-type antimicrobial peptide transport system permease subunit